MRIYGLEKAKVARKKRKLHEEERDSLYCLSSCNGLLAGCLMELLKFESKLS